MPPAPAPDTPPAKYLFTFPHRPNVLDRDRIVVPAGWDSWGKITVVRDGFDCGRWGDAWEREVEHSENSGGGAREMFRVLIGAEESDKVGSLHSRNQRTTYEPHPIASSITTAGRDRTRTNLLS